MIKWFAAFFMTLNHIGVIFAGTVSRKYWLFSQMIGALVFPIFAYSVVLGFYRTRSRFKYLNRMLIFGFLTQMSFKFLLDLKVVGYMGVLFTLGFGILMLMGYEYVVEGIKGKDFAPIIDGILLFALSIYYVHLLKPDHGVWGLALIFVLHLLNKQLPLSVSEPKKLIGRTAVYGAAIFLLRLLLVAVTFYKRDKNPGEMMVLMPIAIFGSQYVSTSLIIDSVRRLAMCSAALFFPFQIRERKPNDFSKYFLYIYYPLHLVMILLVYRIVVGPMF